MIMIEIDVSSRRRIDLDQAEALLKTKSSLIQRRGAGSREFLNRASLSGYT